MLANARRAASSGSQSARLCSALTAIGSGKSASTRYTTMNRERSSRRSTTRSQPSSAPMRTLRMPGSSSLSSRTSASREVSASSIRPPGKSWSVPVHRPRMQPSRTIRALMPTWNRRMDIEEQSVLQLDEKLAEAGLRAVHRGLSRAGLHVEDLTRLHRNRDRLPVLEVGVHGVSLPHADEIGKRVLVEVRRLTRREVHLPDLHALVLEQELRCYVSRFLLRHGYSIGLGSRR